MKIFVIANGYPSEKDPQFGCFEKDQAFELKKQGHIVTILYIDGRYRRFRRKFGISHTIVNDINIYGIYLFPLVFLRLFGYKAVYKFREFLLSRLFKYVLKREDRPDVIYAHYCYNIANATSVNRKYGIPIVGIEHWSKMNQDVLSKEAKYLGENAYNNADVVISVSRALSQSILNHFNVNPRLVNDMIGEEFISHPLSYDKHPTDQCRFISVGSLLPIKRFDVLIRAFYTVSKSISNANLVIIGDGAEYLRLNKLILELSLSDKVFLLGRKSKNEIISNLQTSDVFVVSSESETFGVACAEALSLGIPVVATRCGGPEEFINESNGILVDKNDDEDLASAMIYMIRHLDNYDKKVIADECRSKFAPEHISNQLITIFNEVINNHNTNK